MSQIRQISTSIDCPTCENDELTHRVELSPWDLQLLKLEYIQKGFLFPKLAEKEVDQSLIQHLKVSLSHTLNILYPLAGRLSQIENEDGTTCFFINCNNA
ncbi:putative transferase [Rosa chinensis]|uniref:Putative transferase n=1 Tax=Rosa chinensis TaxID=74649 RepID=A0A2P6RNL2_ROSCH|nr:putative transferase [Rosa chinensis]